MTFDLANSWRFFFLAKETLFPDVLKLLEDSVGGIETYMETWDLDRRK